MITLGHVFFAGAVIDLLSSAMIARQMARANAQSPARGQAVAMVMGLAVLTAIGLVLAGLFLPAAQTPIF